MRRLAASLALLGAAATISISLAQTVERSGAAPRLTPAATTILFDGKHLDHWVVGPAGGGEAGAWAIENGELVVAKPGHGWWLRTKKAYRDFELDLEFNVPAGGNSGIGLRGSQWGDPAFTGLELQVFDSFGQEPSINGCGAVYNAITPISQACKPAGEWNTYRIRLVGDTLNVWLNGVQIHTDARLDDRGYHREPAEKMPLADRLTTGFIALQDHGDRVRYRNITVKDLSADPEADGFVPQLTRSEDFTKKGGGDWSIEPGRIVGTDGPGHLFTNTKFTDFELRASVKVNERGNSGLYIRVEPNADNPDSWPTGYECQVDNHDPKNYTGCIYDRAWPTPPNTSSAPSGPISRDGAWFDYRIIARGNHIQTWINGTPMVDATLTDFATGRIAFQTHHEGNEIEYRDVRILKLD